MIYIDDTDDIIDDNENSNAGQNGYTLQTIEVEILHEKVPDEEVLSDVEVFHEA